SMQIDQTLLHFKFVLAVSVWHIFDTFIVFYGIKGWRRMGLFLGRSPPHLLGSGIFAKIIVGT
ncbi:MAG: hypothetical protein EBV05_10930, partial [Cyanobacteria bacterium WB6_1B_304]|nr:hypothetical protein [Cyanobacteria bacterium WB6_1B_304]